MRIIKSKKQFRKELLKIGRDVRHGLMCKFFLDGGLSECDCYEYNIPDDDVKGVNKFLNDGKSFKEFITHEVEKNIL